MKDNNDDLKQLEVLWKTEQETAATLQFPIPGVPQSLQDAVPIPISSQAREKAAQMADLCRNADRRETMRRNLLATVVVHDYLSAQGYLPDLGASDSWNPILGRTGEVADLFVSQVGRFECCAIKPDRASCSIPSDGQFGRSGYVAVEMDAEERWGWLLGFMPGGDEIDPVETLNRAELQSMDEFGDLLHRLLRDVFDRLEESLTPPPMPHKLMLQEVVNLRQWFNNQIDRSSIGIEELKSAVRGFDDRIVEGWQNLESLFRPEELTPALSMRNSSTRNISVQRGKEIEIRQQNIVLIVKVNPQSEKNINVITEVRPQSGQHYLPEMLQVKLLDDQQNAVMEAIANSTNQNIRFDFNVVLGERFSVQIILAETVVTEEFVM
jgi:hypothetical protein